MPKETPIAGTGVLLLFNLIINSSYLPPPAIDPTPYALSVSIAS